MSAPLRWTPRSGGRPVVERGTRSFPQPSGAVLLADVDLDTRGPASLAAITADQLGVWSRLDLACAEALERGLPYRYCAGPGAPVVEVRTEAQWAKIRARETRWCADRQRARWNARAARA